MKLITKLALIFLFIGGCGFSESIDETDELMKTFFENRIEEGTTGSSRFYSTLFTESTGEQEWERIQSLVLKANGKLLSYEKTGWQVQKKTHTSELSGTFVHYSYNTTYELGEGIELISLVKNSDNPTFRIIKHTFNSSMIQDLINKGIDQAVDSDSLDN